MKPKIIIFCEKLLICTPFILVMLIVTLIVSQDTHQKEQAMQIFPSYDWGNEDELMMAYLSANTNGTKRDKQQSVIDCLNYMWKYN